VSNQTTDEVTVRRAPKIPAFIFAGAALGAIATLVVTSLFPVDPAVGFGALFAYFALYGITGGVVLGALVGIIIDRVSSRRAKKVTVETETVRPDAVTPDAG
jgi:NhaP-type Na+/H+ or K+/H+ antiporter